MVDISWDISSKVKIELRLMINNICTDFYLSYMYMVYYTDIDI